MGIILEVRNLHKSFKRNFWSTSSPVLKGVEFTIPQGSVTGFLGSNGSGKTTTFKCLLGLVKKDQGEVLFFGSPLSLQMKSLIGFLPESIQLYEDLTAAECLLFLGQLSGSSHTMNLKNRIHKLLKQVDLYHIRNQKLKTFSKGMIQKIGLIQSLISKPQFVILDEPFSGLDLEGHFYITQMIEEMKKEGLTIFFSSHILQDLEKVCDRLVILREGSVIFEGDFSELPFGDEESRNILYIQNGQKQNLVVNNQEQCQKELHRILSKEGIILSVSSQISRLEKVYRQLALKK